MSVHYSKEPSWFAKHKITTVILSLVGLFLLISCIGMVRGNPDAKPAGKAKYTATMQQDGFIIVNPATLRVYGEVKNTGTASGKPSCTVQAHDGNYTYTGTDIVTRTSDLKVGGQWDFVDDLTVTHQGAAYVTKVDLDCQ